MIFKFVDCPHLYDYTSRLASFPRRTMELVMSMKRAAKAADMNESSGLRRTAQQLRTCLRYLQDRSFHERLMLASLPKYVKKEGV